MGEAASLKRDNRLVILSHNPFVPALVPVALLDEFRRGMSVPGDAIQSTGPLTTATRRADRAWDKADGLAKLVLQVSHRCNLTCPYCISDAGRWGDGVGAAMPPRIATEALRFFAQAYKTIGTIYLFGGEPTLNLPCVDAVCEEAERLVAKGVLQGMPTIGFTTNGTIVNDRLIRIVRKRPYLKISVSIDGPPEVHDHFRKDVKGRGTYNRILENIKRLREQTGQPSSLEVTYNVQHRRTGRSLWEVMEALHRDLGINVIGVETAYNTTYSDENFDPLLDNFDDTAEILSDAIAQSMRSIAASSDPTYHYHVLAFIQNLFKPHTPNFCPAGRSYFSIASNGVIYPCQNLPETAETRIGKVGDDDLLEKIATAPIRKQLDRANEHADDILGEQWYANFCKVCPAYNLAETGSLHKTAPVRTRMFEAMARSFIQELLRISADDAQYERFLINASRGSSDLLELNVF